MLGFERELQSLDLSEKETKTYLASLELGPNTVQNIAGKAGINRPTAYLQIESLKAKGLMSEFQKGKRTFFTAEAPGRLLSLLNNFQRELDSKKEEISRMLPLLNNLFAGAGERPMVRFLEGTEGAMTLQANFLSVKNKTIFSFTNLDKLFEIFPKHELEYSQKRIAKGIKSRVIYTRQGGPLAGANDPRKLRETKYLPPEKLPIKADITVYDNKVALATYKTKPISVVIESQEIADTLRALFGLIWNGVR